MACSRPIYVSINTTKLVKFCYLLLTTGKMIQPTDAITVEY